MTTDDRQDMGRYAPPPGERPPLTPEERAQVPPTGSTTGDRATPTRPAAGRPVPSMGEVAASGAGGDIGGGRPVESGAPGARGESATGTSPGTRDTTTGTTTGTRDTTTGTRDSTTGTRETTGATAAHEDTGTPLMPHDEVDELQQRLSHTLAGFVEAPRAAVEEADHLLEEIAAHVTDAVSRRRRTLRMAWQGGDAGEGKPATGTDTEQLRLALRDYRELSRRLLHI